MQWNGMRVLRWEWIGVSVIEVVEKKREMGMDAYEWKKNMHAN